MSELGTIKQIDAGALNVGYEERRQPDRRLGSATSLSVEREPYHFARLHQSPAQATAMPLLL